MRLFFAAWPPPDTAAKLALWARQFEGRPTPAENIHLTLAFLGEANPDAATAAARRAEGRKHHLPLEVARYWKHNQILWAGPRETPGELQALVASLHAELRAAAFVLEDRPFSAHVTLLRKAKRLRTLPNLPALDWPIDDFVLVRSSVSSSGASYEALSRFPLG